MVAYINNMAHALVSCGHNVVVLTGRVENLPEKEKIDGITVLRKYGAAQKGGHKALQTVLDAIDSYSIDIVEGADYLGDCAKLLMVVERKLAETYPASCLSQRRLICGSIAMAFNVPMPEMLSTRKA